MKPDELLYAYKAHCVLAERQRLSTWAYQLESYNDAFMDGLKACTQHLEDIKSSPLFEQLDSELRYEILRQTKNMALLSVQISDLKPAKNPSVPSITYQVPIDSEILAMRGMYAGGDQDQLVRLRKLVKTLKTELGVEQMTETMAAVSHYWIDRLPWQVLCKAIRSKDVELAKAALASIPDNNLVLQALLKVHDKGYLLSLITRCAKLSTGKVEEIDTDIVCGHLTFEVLIHDLLTTLEQRQHFNFCLGLPTHHACRDRGAGFCLINKVAVVMAYEELTAKAPFHAVIIGTDVNRDDGLNSILMSEKTTQALTHIDSYDSRVYPWHKKDTLKVLMGKPSKEDDNIWQKGNKCYHSVDLAQLSRGHKPCHAALYYALSQLENLLVKALLKKEEIILFLPTGWDSHEEEEAPCGREINQDRFLSSKESHSRRFNDKDFCFFNQQILELCTQYPDTLCRIYWQLEGGYTENVNVRQLKNMIPILEKHYSLEGKESMENSKAMVC